MNDLFISIDYNDREFEEVQSFKAALEKELSLSDSSQMDSFLFLRGIVFCMHIFINSEIYDFLKTSLFLD